MFVPLNNKPLFLILSSSSLPPPPLTAANSSVTCEMFPCGRVWLRIEEEAERKSGGLILWQRQTSQLLKVSHLPLEICCTRQLVDFDDDSRCLHDSDNFPLLFIYLRAV